MSSRLPAAYRLCISTYPKGYVAEFGDELMAGVADAYAASGRVSIRECCALLLGGLRRRSLAAAARGRFGTVFAGLVGAAVSFALLNAVASLSGAWHRADSDHPIRECSGPTAAVRQCIVYESHTNVWQVVVVVLAVAAVLLIAAGLRRLAGVALLANGVALFAAAGVILGSPRHRLVNFHSALIIFNRLASWGGVTFPNQQFQLWPSGGAAFSLAATVLVPGLLLAFVPATALPVAKRSTRLGVATLALAGLVALEVALPSLGNNQALVLLAAAVLLGVVAGQVDPRLAYAASAVAVVDSGLLAAAWRARMPPWSPLYPVPGLMVLGGAAVLLLLGMLAEWRRSGPARRLAR